MTPHDRRAKRTVRCGAVIALVLAAGCGAPEPDAPPAGEPAPADTPGVPFEGTAGITDVQHDVTGVATLTAVRTARQAGYDRIVYEFADDELPSYHIEYIDRPVRQCGSGNVVPLAGDGWLQMRFEPARAHTEEGRPTITDRERAPGLPVVRELKLTCDFEAVVEWVAGMAAPNRYRVLELSDPTRLVVDVRH